MRPGLLFFGVALLAAMPLAAQAKCKAQEEPDPFSGAKSVVATAESLWASGAPATVKKSDAEFTLSFRLVTSGVVHDSIPANSKIQMKLDSGDLVDLDVSAEVFPEHFADTDMTFTGWRLTTSIDDTKVAMLAEGKYTAVKVPLTSGDRVIEGDDLYLRLERSTLNRAAKCFVKF